MPQKLASTVVVGPQQREGKETQPEDSPLTPKSHSLTSPSVLTRTLEGLTSRWRMRCLSRRYERPTSICRVMWHSTSSGTRPTRDSTVSNEPPSCGNHVACRTIQNVLLVTCRLETGRFSCSKSVIGVLGSSRGIPLPPLLTHPPSFFSNRAVQAMRRTSLSLRDREGAVVFGTDHVLHNDVDLSVGAK